MSEGLLIILGCVVFAFFVQWLCNRKSKDPGMHPLMSAAIIAATIIALKDE